MSWVEAGVERSRRLAASLDRVHAVVSDTATVAALMPRIDHAEPLAEGRWRWIVEEHHALGYSVRPAFTVAISTSPRAVRFDQVPDPDAPDGRAGGGITLAPAGPGATEARVDLRVELDLPIPRLLRGPARAIIELEVRRAIDRFLEALDEHLAGERASLPGDV